MTTQFEHNIEIATKHSQLSSRDLSAFAIDIDPFLQETGLFARIVTKKTGNAECALMTRCIIANASKLPKEVALLLEQVWNLSLRYEGPLDAYQLVIGSNTVELRFVTGSENRAVTGTISVTGFR